MKASRKFWSLLLALVMIVSLMSGAFVVGAADEAITITPTATVGGETITLTVTGVGDMVTEFDLASIGFGTGIEYALWIDHAGSFSFDKAVTLTYQGAAADALEAGKVYSIADGNWSEKYVQLDDGNMLMILDADNPGNFAGLAPTLALTDLPATVGVGAAAPAEEAPAAANGTTITPTATVGGETVTLTATGVGDMVTEFDLASIGFGTGIEYALWFDHDGTFSFDKAVTLTYQGAAADALEAGKVYSIADGNWSEKYVQLDDGNMLMILDADNPGNFAGLAPTLALTDLPATVNGAAAPAAEADIAPAPAGEGAAFAAAAELKAGSKYMIVTFADGKAYALAAKNGAPAAVEVTADDATAVAPDDSVVWIPNATNNLESVGTPGYYIFAGSGGFMLWDASMLRTFTYDAASGIVSMHEGKYQLTFDGAKFDEGDAGCIVKLYAIAGEAAEEAEEPAEEAAALEPIVRSAVKNADGSITLAFSSDVHHNGVDNNLDVWLSLAEAEVGYIDAMGFCGDMGAASLSGAQYWAATQDIMDYMDGQIADGKIGDAIYTTGNHEWFPSGGGNYAVFKSNPAAQRINLMGEGIRTEDYIIYCFGAGEISRTYTYDFDLDDIAALDEYLSAAPTDIPIFILTHFPIHVWVGATSTRYVAHASELIETLNKYPNVVLLWGHNHTEFDENYYNICHAGDEITINPAGDVRTLNFDYLTAGVTSDAEYTGPNGGSAWTLNKGLIVTIEADGTLEYDYYTLDGKVMEEEGPYLVKFRAGYGDYPTIEEQYVEAGKAAVAPEAPTVDGYKFIGWDEDFSSVTTPLVVTAQYEKIIDMSAITVAPTATYGGEALVMTACGVDKEITLFDLASIGYGTGIEYAFWFSHEGTFSFNKDVTLTYQGMPADQLKAGEVYKISEGNYSEKYVQLDDGNMLMILDMANPGNFASLAADTPIDQFPGVIGVPAEPVVSTQKVLVDGEEVAVEHYLIDGYNYFKLRDVAAILNGTDKQFSVSYDKASKLISVVSGEAYEPVGGELTVGEGADKAVLSTQKLSVNGAEQAFTAYNIGGYNFFGLRELGDAIGFGVDFDGENALIITK